MISMKKMPTSLGKSIYTTYCADTIQKELNREFPSVHTEVCEFHNVDDEYDTVTVLAMGFKEEMRMDILDFIERFSAER